MNPVEQKEVLKSFSILVDKREQETKRAINRYKQFGCPFKPATLNYGDYTYNAILTDGSRLIDDSKTIYAPCVVERKMHLDELATCFTTGRSRFEDEFQRAARKNARIILLIENASWEKLYAHCYRSRMSPRAMEASLIAWEMRYNIHIHMCSEHASGALIKELLYRDLKDRLEKGEFDGEQQKQHGLL